MEIINIFSKEMIDQKYKKQYPVMTKRKYIYQKISKMDTYILSNSIQTLINSKK